MSKKNTAKVEIQSGSDNSQIVDIQQGKLEEVFLDENSSYIHNFNMDKHPKDVTGKSVVRKLDKTFVVPMTILYTLQFLDKVVLNYAKIMGMTSDLNLVGNDLSEIATISLLGIL